MSRSVEVIKEIHAPVDEVWRAITEARQLEQWFPVEARVSPPPDGKIWLSWGTGAEGEAGVEHWEPNKHFGWAEVYGPTRIATDFHLEARGNTTVVRIVTSGFSDAPEWDDEFHMIEGGWRYFAAHLKVYVERHLGEQRTIASERRDGPLSKREAFDRLVRALGFTSEPAAGARVRVTTAEGDVLEGSVIALNPGVQLGLHVENLNHAMLFIEMEGKKDRAKPALWLSTYGLDGAAQAQLAARMKRLYEAALR